MSHRPTIDSLSARSPNRFRSRASLTALAAAGAIAAPAIAEAQIVYSGILNTSTSVGYMSLLFQGTPTDGSELILQVLTPKKGATSVRVQVSDFGSGGAAIDFSPATLGATVDASRTFSTTSAVLGGVLDTSYYYAFTYSPVGEDLYGWFHYTTSLNGTTPTMTLNDWAYNSVPGEAITVGQTVSAIPEPADIGALLGVVALAAVWVRRRKRGTVRQP